MIGVAELSRPPDLQERFKEGLSAEAKEVFEIFLRLHEVINDPDNRPEAAQRKNQLVAQIAREQLKDTEGRITVEEITATHEQSGTETYNTLVTLGDTSTGPTLLVMVHHDIIKNVPKDHQGKIPLEYTDVSISGRTVQDDTMHLAAALYALRKVAIPEKGAIIFAFTDHEEDGAIGSRAIEEIIREKVVGANTVGLLAMESVQVQNDPEVYRLGVGHKGKADIWMKGESNNVAETFLGTSAAIISNGIEMYDLMEDLLGRSAGTSNAGVIEQGSQTVRVDVRTNNSVPPGRIVGGLEDQLKNPTSLPGEVLERARKNVRKGLIRCTKTGNLIQIDSSSAISHPANFDPHQDETILPTAYLTVAALVQKYGSDAIKRISWGDIKSGNNLPRHVEILLNDGLADVEELLNSLGTIKDLTRTEVTPLEMSVYYKKTVLTNAVLPKDESIGREVLKNFGMEEARMSYMTDIGPIFHILENSHRVFPFIFGMGIVANLHHMEEMTTGDIHKLAGIFPELVNYIQNHLPHDGSA